MLHTQDEKTAFHLTLTRLLVKNKSEKGTPSYRNHAQATITTGINNPEEFSNHCL